MKEKEEGKDWDEVILGFVDRQIKKNDPAKVRETYERLISMGFSEGSSRNLIAGVLSSELYQLLCSESDDDRFDFVRYAEELDSLP